MENNYNEVKKGGFKNKKVLVGLAILIVLVAGVICLFVVNSKRNVEVNDLKVKYSNPVVKVNGAEKGFTKTYKITVKNTTNELKTYSLEWIKIKNNFKEQNKLLYEIKGTGPYAASLGKSQVPVAGFKVFNQVAIQALKTQKYEIILYYDGKTNKDKKSLFEGTLNIVSEKVVNKENKKKKMKEDMEKRIKEMESKHNKEKKKIAA